MKVERIREILEGIRRVKVVVMGDFCIDAYWMMDARGGEISEETGLAATAVGRHYYSLGGAANIAANLAALGPAEIRAIGVIGDDIFGRELVRQLEGLKVDTRGLVVQKEQFDTITFGKRYLEGSEEPRIDFGVFNRRSRESDDAVIAGLREALSSADVVILNQQMPGSITNDEFIDEVNRLLDEFNEKIVLLDMRHYGHRFRNVHRRANAREAARLVGVEPGRVDVVELEEVKKYGKELFRRSAKPVFITRGQWGSVVCDGTGVHEVMGMQVLGKVDPVGAGDTLLSALASALATGATPVEAATFANFAATVTVQKIFQTGTASSEEVLAAGEDPDYIYQPELATDAGRAKKLAGSEIEACYEMKDIPLGRVKHVVFDHDGTISTLRHGWEDLMRPMMAGAILGEQSDRVSEKVRLEIEGRVAEYIDKSTGYETIIQMEALVGMVREFGLVPGEKVLTAKQYKDIYTEMVRGLSHARLKEVERGERTTADFTVTGTVEFLKELRRRGIRLYLASGTDEEDTIAEAKALGYAELFDGGIYGAVGDMRKFSKKLLIHRILEENGLEGAELAVMGDGPVEMRESRKREGLAIGIASNETERGRLNRTKRARLVRAGAHFIAADFTERERLIGLMLGK